MSDAPTPPPPTNETAYFLYEAMARMGVNPASREALHATVDRLMKGLPHEDEFVALARWLGRCKAITKLGQAPATMNAEYKVPDLLALFDVAGSVRPFLIEVKATERDELKWSAGYYAKLSAYSEAVGIPLLLAWKCKRWGVWTLVDASLLRGGVRIDFLSAMKKTLMGVVAGDFAVVLKDGIGVHFVADPVTFHGDGQARTAGGLLAEGNWTVRICDAYFSDAQGTRRTKVSAGIWAALLASQLDTETSFEEGQLHVSYTVPTAPSHMSWAHGLLHASAAIKTSGVSSLDWREVLTDVANANVSSLLADIQESIGDLVHTIIVVEPDARPQFLPQRLLRYPHGDPAD